METKENTIELLKPYAHEEAMTANGFDDAIIGLSVDGLFVYDIDDCVQILMKDGMTNDEANEYMDFNVTNAYVGVGTPIFIYQKESYE